MKKEGLRFNYNVRQAENIYISGDIAAGQLLLPYAYQMMRMIRLNGMPVMNKTLEGSNIRVEFVNGQGRIFITGESTCNMYMESGIFDMQASMIGVCSEASYLPAKLNYTGWIGEYISSVEFPMQGEVEILHEPDENGTLFKGESIPNGSFSLSLGCEGNKRINSVTPCSVTFSSASYYCGDLYARKFAQRYLPASNFSGKLALLVQAIYGSKRSDYIAIDANNGILSIAGITIEAGYKPSYGLHTTDDYKYFLIRITDYVTYWPIEITSCGEAFLDILRDGDITDIAEVKRIEAYALSTATIKSGKSFAGSVVDTEGGSPLHYGWAWAWDGKSADVCTHRENPWDRTYDTIHFSLIITSSKNEDGTYSFSEHLSIVSQEKYWPLGIGLRLIKPLPYLGTMTVVPSASGIDASIPYPDIDEPMDVTVHVYRNSLDELVVCEYTQDFEVRTDSDIGAQTTACWDAGGEAIFQDIKDYNGVVGNNSLTIGDDTQQGRVQSTSSHQKQTTLAGGMSSYLYDISSPGYAYQPFLSAPMCGGGTTLDWLLGGGYIRQASPGSPLYLWADTGETGDPCFGVPVKIYYSAKAYRVYKGGEFESSSTGRYVSDTLKFLMVPYNSCSHVITATRDIDDHGLMTHGWSNGYTTYSTPGFIEVFKKSWCSDVGDVEHGSVEFGTRLFGNVSPTIDENELIQPSNKMTATVSLHGAGTQLLYTEHGAEGEHLLSRYFDLVDTTLTDSYDSVVNSTAGDAKAFFEFTSYLDEFFPGHSAVGWA